jgi:hypothetical protein
MMRAAGASVSPEKRGVSRFSGPAKLPSDEDKMRGLQRVRAEWKLVCMPLNLRRMATMTA